MFPIDLGLLGVIIVLIQLIIQRLNGKALNEIRLDILLRLGTLSLLLGVFGTIAGLFQALGALEANKEGWPFYIIAGGLRVALITVLYGCLVYIVALIGYLVLKFTAPKS